MKSIRFFRIATLGALVTLAPLVHAYTSPMTRLLGEFIPTAHARSSAGAMERKAADFLGGSSPSEVKATGRLEVGFSPNGGAEALVLKVIDTADTDLKVMAYSFTSAKVVSALLRAVHRGVKVSIVADQKDNLGPRASRNARAALSALVEAGAEVRMISAFAISHDKVIISGSKHVETGSFNFSQAAATKNSENVIVNWDNPDLARVYLGHFERNWKLGVPFHSDY